jgi:two-component system nitrate/nitrite response regulator NarL
VIGVMTSILLAEEQPLFLDAVRARLEAEPDIRVVASARNGTDTVAEAERHRPDVVILSDGLSMCGSLGAAQLMAERVPLSRILMLAADGRPPMVVSALSAGVTGYLDKACSFEELLQAIRCVQRGDTWIPPRMLGPTLALVLQSREEAFARRRVLERLSRREKAVLALLARGQNNKSMAQALMISPQTAKTHVQNVMQKLGVHSRIAAAAFAMYEGILEELDACR